jgi:WNK lysine deficient protein kinase
MTEVERSPNSRYSRFKELLGSGAFKKVYKGVDTELGIEIAWAVCDLDRSSLDLLRKEKEIVSRLDHPHVLKLYDSWIDEEKMQEVFITEVMNSGTLKQLRALCSLVDALA